MPDVADKVNAFSQMMQLSQRLNEIEADAIQKYIANVLQGLKKEARKLRYLNYVLISLTAILAILTAILAFRL
jgi:hypothetical protein